MLMVAVHATDHILVGDLAKHANSFFSCYGEDIQLTAHAVGDILASFGMKSNKRASNGWVLDFDQKVRRKVHQIVKRYGVEYGTSRQHGSIDNNAGQYRRPS